ncbi:MAG TPA: HAD family hydrolase [Xanthomonadaceae bacterium]|nr:HAD family hydrolase [Xanthomonadaceae bacterium]
MLMSDAAGEVAGNVVFLLDVDNTLLDNDRFSADLDAALVGALGEAGRVRYRAAYEALRDAHGYADYPGALQALRGDRLVDDAALLQLGDFLLDYPFGERVYPGSHAALAHVATLGVPVILSDGDLVFQPRKIRRSGLWDAVQGRVLLSVHKERMLDAVQQAYPARHYVVVDDKPKVLQAIKENLGARVTTVFVHQGHYAREADLEHLQPPDLSLAHIGELVGLDTGKDVLLHRSLALVPELSSTAMP